MNILIALAALLATTAASAQTSDQFDLICSGSRTATLSGIVTAVEPFTSELRINLAANAWCGGDCARIYDIDGAVTASEIVLTDDHQGEWEAVTKVDRQTGKFTASNYHTAYGVKSGGYSEGQCTRTPFKPMPAP
jgi:hypothetical protein